MVFFSPRTAEDCSLGFSVEEVVLSVAAARHVKYTTSCEPENFIPERPERY